MIDLANLRTKINSTRERVERELQGQRALCRRPVERLTALCDVLASLDVEQRQHVEKSFADTVAAYRKAIGWQAHYSWMLYWIATGQRLVGEVHDIHLRIDAIYAALGALGVAEAPELRDAWRDHWDAEYAELVRWLVSNAGQCDAEQFRAQVRENPIKIREFLAIIKLQLAVYDDRDQDMGDQDQDMDAPGHEVDRSGHSVAPEMLALMKDTLAKLWKSDPGVIYTWFIPKEDVTFDPNAAFGGGSFGVLYEGTWTGIEGPVGVKILDETGDNGAAFSREFNTWWPLRHDNILTMYGANHVAAKRFFVCEITSENLATFFRDGCNREQLWTKFSQAAEGLAFLHSNSVQHGGIKISNLLLTADGTVKLSDFGLSVVRDQSKTMSRRPKEHGTRWMAPEEVTETDVSINRLQADVYSLGLCIIEAVTGTLPFPDMDDKEVYESKRRLEPVQRPVGAFSDEEWGLVVRMVDNDPDQRPTADDLVMLIPVSSHP